MSPPSDIREFLDALGQAAPWTKAGEWDAVGLQLGDPEASLSTVGVCHEVTDAVTAALEAAPVDLVVSYHPLLFRPARSLTAGPTPEGRVLRLARIGVAVASVHTNFDVAPGGTADALAEALGLEEPIGFGPLHGSPTVKLVTFVPEAEADRVLEAGVEVGAARIGSYTHCSFRTSGTGTFYAGRGTKPSVGESERLNREPEVRLEFVAPRERLEAVLSALVAAHPYEEPAYDVYERRGDDGMVGRIGRTDGLTLAGLAERVVRQLGAASVRCAGDENRLLRSVAVVPGSGSEFIGQAADRGADAVVTGDITHHRARAALDRGLVMVDPGHVATERPGVRRLEAIVRGIGVECRSLLDLDPDPWQRP